MNDSCDTSVVAAGPFQRLPGRTRHPSYSHKCSVPVVCLRNSLRRRLDTFDVLDSRRLRFPIWMHSKQAGTVQSYTGELSSRTRAGSVMSRTHPFHVQVEQSRIMEFRLRMKRKHVYLQLVMLKCGAWMWMRTWSQAGGSKAGLPWTGG